MMGLKRVGPKEEIKSFQTESVVVKPRGKKCRKVSSLKPIKTHVPIRYPHWAATCEEGGKFRGGTNNLAGEKSRKGQGNNSRGRGKGGIQRRGSGRVRKIKTLT